MADTVMVEIGRRLKEHLFGAGHPVRPDGLVGIVFPDAGTLGGVVDPAELAGLALSGGIEGRDQARG